LDLDTQSAGEGMPTLPLLQRPPEKLSYHLLLRRLLDTGYRIEREIFRGYPHAQKSDRIEYFERDRQQAIVFDSAGRTTQASPERLEEGQTILRQTSRAFSTPEMFLLYTYLKGWGIHQDLNVCQDSPVRRAAITRREMQLASNGENLIATLHTLYTTDKDFKTDVNDAMRAAFGREFEELEFTPAEDQRIQLRLRWKSLKNLQSAADLSDGTLRFLMLLAVLVNRSRGDLVAVDEPETGLHPSMFPIIAELAAEASRSSQIIFTTHSPEFLTALGLHGPTTTVVQAVDGETKLSVLEGEDLKKWLEKYKLGEMFLAGDLEALA
jgi:predicted ATPase